MTVAQVRDRSKTVTRRHIDTWRNLKAGDRLTLIEKGMGLPKGARQVVLTEVEITDVRVEELGAVTSEECAREGFPEMSPAAFIGMWVASHGYPRGLDPTLARCVECRRIEFRYLDDEATS